MNFTAFGLASLLGMAASVPALAEPAHPTIRHMASVPSTMSLDAARTALLVVDFQNEYFGADAASGFSGGRMVIPDGVAALQQARRLVQFADTNGIRVIHVQHVLPASAPLLPKAASTRRSTATCSRATVRPSCRRTLSASLPVTRLRSWTRC